jgi:aminoglycoside 3-N-acetyltransferase
MPEATAIDSTRTPVTVASLKAELEALGLRPGMTVLVHSSLKSLGWVCGGAPAVVLALEAALGPEGTLVMPTHSGDLSDPAEWRHPPVPEGWWETIRQHMPAYDPHLTPAREMGAIPETFRKQQGVLRSLHPQTSFAAWGRQARFVTGGHELASCMGEASPLARIYELDGWVLLLGVGHANNSSLHLAEYRAEYPGKRNVPMGAPIVLDGARQWVTFEDLETDEAQFPALGDDFARDTGLERRGPAGTALARFMPQRALVDYAVGWIEARRAKTGT